MSVLVSEQFPIPDPYKSYVQVGVRNGWRVLVNPETTCLHRMRPWATPSETQDGFCTLDRGHRGRHSTVTFFCDVCGKNRRGQPAYQDDSVAVCFMCRHTTWGRP